MSNNLTNKTSQENNKKSKKVKKTVAEWEKFEEVIATKVSRGKVPYLNSLIHSKIFCAVTPIQRKKLKKRSSLSKSKYISDAKVQREYLLEDDFNLVLDGPILCMFDASVFFTTVGEYILSGAVKGKGRLEVSLREIARKLGYTNIDGNLLKRIYGSYRRLNSCEIILADAEGKEIWFSRPIAELEPYRGGRNSRLKLKLSDDIVDLYLSEGYNNHSIDKIKGMTQLEQLLFLSFSKSSKAKINAISKGAISEIAPTLYEKTTLDLSKKGDVWIQEKKSWGDATAIERKSYYALIRKTLKNIGNKITNL